VRQVAIQNCSRMTSASSVTGESAVAVEAAFGGFASTRKTVSTPSPAGEAFFQSALASNTKELAWKSPGEDGSRV
jgi:hypothetical protein